ncbi:sugar ABC transporter ATP-binding protein [Schumannella soli]|uniref:Sugar ABC transporter ATP-binding protein n=1 Tax=Schumannella soli TaxID=2590779 RepID=A0A506XYZ2_9MICO|nr:sugar ABC transporter ATP-binding protein [Schumannella soli]TPW74823.1 sugar ABC transporter ATP-binding protein [Schumannella soli]
MSAESTPAIVVDGVVKTYGGVRALKGVDLTIPAGTVEALVGANGAGKSTLIGVLTGRVAATEGTVTIGGVQPKPGEPTASRAAGLVAIYQELTIVPGLSAEDNVFLGMTPSSAGVVRGREIHRRYLELCSRLGVRIDGRQMARRLSVADQQILEIMRALVAEAKIILLDEPTAALSDTERVALVRLVKELRSQGVTMIFVSHNLEEVLDVADHVTVLRDGRVVQQGPVAEWDRTRIVDEMLGEAGGLVKAELAGDVDENGVDTSVTVHERRDDQPLIATGISLPGLLYDIAIDVRPGEIVGLGGLVGSGRTTLLRCLAGLEPKSTGTLRIGGSEVRWPKTPRAALDAGVALIPEDRKNQGLVLGMTAAENIAIARYSKVATAGVMSTAQLKARTAELVTEFGFDPARLGAKAGTLSGGNQQKLLLARWRFLAPKILLADEPTRGVDVGAKEEILKALRRFAADGIGVIIASSELEEVSAVADRIIVLRDGRAVDELIRGTDPVHVDAILAAAFGEGHHDKEATGA